MNSAMHFDTDAWLAYAGTSVEASQREAMDAHAGECAACSALRRSSRELVSSLADERTWSEKEPTTAPAGTLFDRIRFAAIVHARERSRAASSVTSLLELSDEALVRELEAPRLATASIVSEFASRARATVERDPRRALFLADLAVSLSRRAESSPETLYAQGSAFKERGNALRFLGDLPQALGAYAASRESFLASSLGAIDAAQVDLGRALVFRETGDLAQAAALARASAATFLEFGDARRSLHARFLEGGVAFSLGQIAQAKDIFLELLNAAQEQDDLDSLARLFNNIGRCYVELGDPDSASTYLLQAIATYRELGIETEVIRTKWALARMLLHAGRAGDAASRLADVAAEFAAHGMLMDAALASLDRAEALLVLGRAGEVPFLLEGVLARFTSAGAHTAAITALSYLKEAVREGSSPQKKLTHVRTFLERLPYEPNLLFLPMPE